MSIQPMLASGSFSPEDVTVLRAVFEDCIRHLGLADRDDPAVTMVAKRIIALAQEGERNPVILRAHAVKSFENG
jgi:hypothetical protein